MINRDQQTFKRAMNAALAGGAVQLVISAALLLAALWSSNAAVGVAAWHAFGGLGIWLCLIIVYKQHALERIESLEAEQIAQRHGTDSSIFETTADDLAVHRRRLQRLYQWFVPAVSLLTAAYLIGIGAWQLVRLGAEGAAPAALSERATPLALAFTHLGTAFIAFIVSRYVAGMGRAPEWRILRGGAAYLMGVAVVTGVLCGFFFFVSGSETTDPLRYPAYVLPVLMIVIGAEISLNLLFNVYRPRRAGETHRPAFDSRLLSLLTSPESLAKTINEAINYQFGFEITRSWFWQLLSRWFGALVGMGLAVLALLSCIVVVEPNQRALVMRFGQVIHTPQNPSLGPGIHFKPPWPIGRAQVFDVTRVRELKIGSDINLIEVDRQGNPLPILWDNEHIENPDAVDLLIVAETDGPRGIGTRTEAPAAALPTDPAADPAAEGEPAAASAPTVSLVNSEIMLHYRVDPDRLLDYVRSNADAEEQNESRRDRRLYNIAIQQVSRYLLRHNIDEWIGTARVTAGQELAQLVQQAADSERLGVKVIGVSVASVHPPFKVAANFQDAIAAVQEAEQKRQVAIKEQVRELTAVAGSVEGARQIHEQIMRLNEMRDRGEPIDQINEQERAVERAILASDGDAAAMLSWARSDRWDRENREKGRAARFLALSAAYEAAPDFFRQRALLEAWEESTSRSRKIIVGATPGRLILRGDFKEQESAAFEGALEDAAAGAPVR